METTILTPRQKTVLAGLAAGFTHKDIALLLHISPRTVEVHKANISKRLHLHTRASLVLYAHENGLVWREVML